MSEKLGRRLFTGGAIWLILIGCVHSISLFRDLAPSNPTEKQLLDLMTSYHFNLMGSMRSMDNLLRGFSTSFMLAPIALGVLDLGLCRERAGLLRRVALIQILWFAASLVVSLRYFFAMPTSFLAGGLVIFVLAWISLPAQSRLA